MPGNRIRTFVEAVLDSMVDKYRLVILVMLVISVPMLYFYSKQHHYNHISIYFDTNDPDLAAYRAFQKRYGNEELACIVFKKDTIFTNESIGLIRILTERVGGMAGIQRVFSLTKFEEARGENDTVTFARIVPEGELGKEELLDLRRRALANKVLVNNLISPDGTTTAIMAELLPTDDNEKKMAVLRNLKRECDAIAGPGTRLRFAGVPFGEVEMNDYSKRDFVTFTPLTLLMIFIVITLSLKNLTLSLLSQANMFIILIWGIGFYAMTGETFNMITVILGPMLLTCATENSIHVLSEFEDDYHALGGKNNYPGLIKKTLKDVWLPCFFTCATTSVGFFSFGPASVRPVQILGIFTAVTVLFGYFITMAFLPAGLMLLEKRFHAKLTWKREQDRQGESGIVRLLVRLVQFDLRHYKSIALVTVAILVLATAVGFYKLHFETNIISYLPKESRLKQDIRFIEKNLGGTIPSVILIQAKDAEHDFHNPESLLLLDEIQHELMRLVPVYTSSFSIADYAKQVNRAFNNGDEAAYAIPPTRDAVAEFFEIGDPETLDRLVAPDYREARLSFQAIWRSNDEAVRQGDQIKAYLNKRLGPHYGYRFTGLSSLYVRMQDNLFVTQIYSFVISFGMIFIMMYFICGGFFLALISMLPNIFPIFLTLGVMGVLDIPFDVATIMIGGVTIGIVIDDTTHYMVWFRRNMGKGMTHRDAIVQTFHDVGRPTFITSIVLCLGFLILVFGSLQTTRMFGVLTAFTMLVAPFGDYLMLPALLLLFKPKVKGLAAADQTSSLKSN